jgi:hypothetical protein
MYYTSKIKSVIIPLFLLIFLCVNAPIIYSQNRTSLSKSLDINNIIQTLKPGITKIEVKELLREPYKYSFYLNDKQELVEQLYYKAMYFYSAEYRYISITYTLVLVNGKLTALQQEDEDDNIRKLLELIKKQ